MALPAAARATRSAPSRRSGAAARSWRSALAVAATALLVLAAPLAADAHVRVYPKQAVAGADDTLLTLSVPTESATATTTRVVIGLPTATPFGDVGYQPVDGWSARVVTATLPKPAEIDGTRVTEAPTQVVWTALPGTRLTAGQFQDFVLTVGPMPDTGQIAFPTVQTYSDGSVERWTQPTPASGDEPEHPAPVLYVNDQPPAEDRAAGSGVGLSAESSASSATATIGVVLGAAGLVLGLLALVVLLIGVRRTRSR